MSTTSTDSDSTSAAERGAHRAGAWLRTLGPPGRRASAIFSGFGAFLAELCPTAPRGAGQGFTYDVGRAVGAFFPTVGGYGVAVIALLGLPETAGRELT